MIKHKEQRVGVLVDVSNMYHSSKNLYHKRVNFKEVLKTAVAGRKLIRAIAYAVKTETEEELPFFDALYQLGFEVRMKDLQIFSGGAKKADWDVGITVDAIKLSEKFYIFLSSDFLFQIKKFPDRNNYYFQHHKSLIPCVLKK